MIYMTEKQFSMLKRFQRGEIYHFWNDPQTDEVVRYLMDNGLCTAREDIVPDMIMLTEKGKAVLAESEKEIRSNKEEEINNKNDSIFYFIKAFFKRFWAAVVALSVIVTIFGWPMIIKAARWIASFFQ